MANGNTFDSNRDGIDDNVDRRPGNDNDSRSYARIFDPRAEQEYTNLPEPQNVLEQQQVNRQRELRARARHAMGAAQQDVHFFPDVGKFIIPAENTWAAHAELVQNNEMRLQFNPDKYFFDKIIADKLNIPALTDRKHPDFSKYKGLRTNLEVLRNDIIGQYLDDGGFDKGDEVYIAPLKGIAEVIGQSLANDVWWKRPFTNHFSFDVANVEGVGAVELYKYLLRQQDKKTALLPLKEGFRDLVGLPTKNWGLLDLDKSPFSPQGMIAPPPKIERIMEAPSAEFTFELAEHRAMESLALIKTTNEQFKPVDRLAEPEKKMSIEDGRTILRWLKNLQGMDMDVQDFLSTGTVQEQMAKATQLSQLVTFYTQQMRNNTHLHADAVVKEGADAAGAAAMMIAEHAISLLPESTPAHALLASAIDTMPEVQFERSSQSTGRLLAMMEDGLTHLAGKKLEKNAAIERLIQVSDRMGEHAKQLRSVDTLTQPKREESVELGREILRKLKNLFFTSQPLEEMVDSGRPEDKATMAEKLEEMVEIYRNLLAQALVANPGLADDARIKAANDAVGTMTHGIKLMASKEIPNSMAQAQQIAADITQMPEDWKKLDGRAVNRLVASMEGGLEAAVASMDQQSQDQERDEDVAQEVINALHSDNARRKRRKKRQQKSGLGGKKQLKTQQELAADDRAAGQGRFREAKEGKLEKHHTQPIVFTGFNEQDFAALKHLGGALNNANREAKSLTSMEDLTTGTPVSPDDKTAAERAIEQAKNSRGKNGNNNRRTT